MREGRSNLVQSVIRIPCVVIASFRTPQLLSVLLLTSLGCAARETAAALRTHKARTHRQ